MTSRTGLVRLCPRGQTARLDSVGKGAGDDSTSCPHAAMRLCPPYDSTRPTPQTTAPAAAVIHCSSFALGATPTWREAISPFLKTIRVGLDITLHFAAGLGLSSALRLAILTFPDSGPSPTSSRPGAIIPHRPPHSPLE